LAIELNYDSSEIWDMNNTAGQPVAGGMYIFHISAGSKGDKIIKALIFPD
jgi:hypothetical protein